MLSEVITPAKNMFLWAGFVCILALIPYCDYQFIPKTPWNYGYAADDFEVTYHSSGDVPFSQDKPPVTVRAKMQKINWGLKFPYRSIARKIPKSRAPISAAEEIELCPYGCARLRMTEMPLISK